VQIRVSGLGLTAAVTRFSLAQEKLFETFAKLAYLIKTNLWDQLKIDCPGGVVASLITAFGYPLSRLESITSAAFSAIM
jgi:hypothetical protein